MHWQCTTMHKNAYTSVPNRLVQWMTYGAFVSWHMEHFVSLLFIETDYPCQLNVLKCTSMHIVSGNACDSMLREHWVWLHDIWSIMCHYCSMRLIVNVNDVYTQCTERCTPSKMLKCIQCFGMQGNLNACPCMQIHSMHNRYSMRECASDVRASLNACRVAHSQE